jgi:signal transduction histidine kinase
MKQSMKMFGLLIGLTVLGTMASGISLLYAWHMRKALDRSLTEDLWETIATADLDIALLRQKGLVASYLLEQGNGKWLGDLPRYDAEFRLTIDKMLKECASAAECAMLRDIKGAYDEYDRVRDHVVALYKEGRHNEATDMYLQQIGAQYARVAKLSSRHLSHKRADLEKVSRSSQNQVWRLTFFVIASALLTAALGGALIWLLFERLYRPLRELAVTAESLTAREGRQAASTEEDDLKALERSLKILVSDLSGTRADLDATRRQLQHSERLASVGNAVAQLLHDIKNRLLVVGLYTTSISRNAGNVQQTRTQSKVVLDELRKLENILRDIRDFSKPMTLHQEMASLNLLVEKTTGRLAEQLPAGTVIEQDLDRDIADLLLDQERIEQVVINLIHNGLEALGSEGKIRVATRRDGTQGVILTIEDNGPGIPEPVRQRIFDPFFTTKRTGNGLGLAICREIIEEHGGSIRLDTQFTRGARFEVRFPAPPRVS